MAGHGICRYRSGRHAGNRRQGDYMLRNVDIDEISDGKFYLPDDMVPTDCGGCAGCSDCCRNTGDSIILDPYDMYRLTAGLHLTFTDMIEKQIEIRLVDGLILPNLMEHDEKQEEKEDGCPFLGDDGRCTIHAFRPSLCRMFPMGRYYPDPEELRKKGGQRFSGRAFVYILQKNECPGRKGAPVLLRDWLDTPDLDAYEKFAADWHDFLRTAGPKTELLTGQSADQMRRYILQVFFVQPYQTEKEFYPQYAARRKKVREVLEPVLRASGRK